MNRFNRISKRDNILLKEYEIICSWPVLFGDYQ
jgi:hypothetical protein